MDFFQIVSQEFGDLANAGHMIRAVLRLGLAAILGGVLGWERQRSGKEAGLRTHMLVAVGAAFFVFAPQQAGMVIADQSRVIQGLVAGIGFIGGGAILKLSDKGEIKGLTTAAGIWLTAAVGVAVGLGHLGDAVVCTLMALLILSVQSRIEKWLESKSPPPKQWI